MCWLNSLSLRPCLCRIVRDRETDPDGGRKRERERGTDRQTDREAERDRDIGGRKRERDRREKDNSAKTNSDG